MVHHIKSKSINVQTGEEVVTHFTDEEWAAAEQARLDAEAAEAARDPDEEEIDQMGRIFLAFLRAYADREGVTMSQVRTAIKAHLQ